MSILPQKPPFRDKSVQSLHTHGPVLEKAQLISGGVDLFEGVLSSSGCAEIGPTALLLLRPRPFRVYCSHMTAFRRFT